MESARSRMELMEALRSHQYPNEIGPVIYDIHSPRVPSVEEIRDLLTLAFEVLKLEQLWVNPDSGLKTRSWPETIAALENMCKAAGELRARFTVSLQGFGRQSGTSSARLSSNAGLSEQSRVECVNSC
jgi:5-methyltetrahydropteroyltriglutamate--homocysteine methyltransferase